MEMEALTEKLYQEIKKRYGEKIRTGAAAVRMNNGIMGTDMQIIMKPDVILTVGMDKVLEDCISGIPFKDIIRKLMEDIEKIMEKCKNINTNFFHSFGAVKDRICYRLVNRDKNRELLSEIPHVVFLDLALCFYYACCGNMVEGSIQIDNYHMKQWDTSTTELLGLAACNTQRLLPWECRSVMRILEGRQQEEATTGEGLPSDSDWFKQPVPMSVLGNRLNLYGAVCIHYPEVLGRLAQEAGNDLYILPSSVHETILLPNRGGVSAQELKEMICDINRELVLPEEVLSDSLYYYSRSEQQVRII